MHSNDRAEVQKVCDVFQSVGNTNHCLQLLVEDFEFTQRMWRLNWREARLNYLHNCPTITFGALLQSLPKPSLIERRRLALVFAYSLFQLHESPWLSSQWEKDQVHFFYKSVGNLDLQRPYLCTSFDHFPLGGEVPDPDRFHRNLGILRLGILLIEAHKWMPIEKLRQEEDLHGGAPTPNTDMNTASRVLSTLDDCFPTYRGAIGACLKLPWVPSSSRVSLEDLETWCGVYEDVIDPLEREVALGDYMFKG